MGKLVLPDRYTGVINQGQLLNLNTLMDNQWITPQRFTEIYQEYNFPVNIFYNFIKQMARYVNVNGDTFTTYMKGWERPKLHVLADVADQGVGAKTSFSCSAQDVNSGSIWTQVGTTLEIPRGGGLYVEARVWKILPSGGLFTIYIEPVDATQNIGALTAGMELINHSQAYGEQSGQPNGRTQDFDKRTYGIQTYKATTQFTGDAMAYTYDLYYKKGVPYGYIWETTQMHLECMRDISNSFMLGDEDYQLITSAYEASLYGNKGAGKRIRKTKGTLNWIYQEGGSLAVAVGAEAMADFQTMKAYWNANGCYPTNAMVFTGETRQFNYQQVTKDYNDKGGGTSYVEKYKKLASIGGHNASAEALQAMFDIVSLTYGGIKFHLTEVAEFSNPMGLGADGYGGQELCVVMPLNNFVVMDENGNETEQELPTFGILNKVYDNGASMKQQWQIGGAGYDPGKFTSAIDELDGYYREKCGLLVAHPQWDLQIQG